MEITKRKTQYKVVQLQRLVKSVQEKHKKFVARGHTLKAMTAQEAEIENL